jgi:threonine dehydrogenase-like Zn-dependent dehydrogenase
MASREQIRGHPAAAGVGAAMTSPATSTTASTGGMMRAFVVTGAKQSAVLQVPRPVAAPGAVVVDVERVGVCGTDVEFFTGEMAYLHQGHAEYPMRLGHEWCGTVTAVGDGVDPAWIGRRTTGDTMLGCGRCRRCLSGLHHVCADRFEIGIRGGFPGALAEQLAVPATALHALPDTVDAVAGAMVEPGGNAWRSVQAAALQPGDRLLVLGPGTIGLLVAEFALAAGAEVHLVGRSERSRAFAHSLGRFSVWTTDTLPELPFDAVIDASNAPDLPARALDLVQPGKRVVYVGLAGTPSRIDTRTLALKDVTAVGILSASPGLAGTIAQYACGAVDPRPLVAATIGLDQVGDVLSGLRPVHAGPGPKIHVDPRLRGDS